MTHPTVPEPEEIPVAELTRGTWIQAIDEDGCDHGEAEVLHVEAYQGSAVVLYRPRGLSDPRTSYFDDANNMVPVLSAERLAEAKAVAERAEFAAGLYQFADWVTANPWAPTMRDNGFRQSARLQIDLYGPDGSDADAATVARVREIASRLGVKVDDVDDDRTSADATIGSVSYAVIAWHKGGRPAEPEKTEPLPADDLGFGYSREEDPTPVSPARGGPVHTGGVVDGGQLVDETPAIPIQATAERQHPVGNGTQKVFRFDNNYGASVVQFRILGMDGSFGASKGLWELAVLQFTGKGVQFDPANWELTYDTPITQDVIGGLGDDEVQEILAQIRDLPVAEPVAEARWHECEDPAGCGESGGHQAPEPTFPAQPVGGY